MGNQYTKEHGNVNLIYGNKMADGNHHHHHHHGHSCDHAHGDPGDLSLAYSLYQKIDLINVKCLNESEEDSGKKVFKPWEERLDTKMVTVYMYMYLNGECI